MTATSASMRMFAPVQERYTSGEVIEGKYRLIRPIGEGGYSRVWLAHNTVLDVQVAVKLVYLDDGEGRSFVERALAEARSAAHIGHPAIINVFDFGITDREDPFVAMEYLHGQTLADRIAIEGRMSATEAVQLLLPIADALAAAHAVGIVHRDVKPENIFITRNSRGRVQPKLLDFGIARRINANHRITAEGSVVGTPDYMSPEQARGEVPDERTDVWSFCVVLYELISGRVPFYGDNYNALLTSIIEREAAPVTELLCGDQELWKVIAKGLSKNADDRWPSMRALGETLALWLLAHGIQEDSCAVSLRGVWVDQQANDEKIEITRRSNPEPAPVTREAVVPARRSAIFALGLATALALLIGGASLAIQDRAGASVLERAAARPPAIATHVQPTETTPPTTPEPRRVEPPPSEPEKPKAVKPVTKTKAVAPPMPSAAPGANPIETPLDRAKKIDFGF